MNRRTGVMMVLVTAVLALMFLAAPAAQAACTDTAGPGVDWSGCTLGPVLLLANADLSGANLTNTTINVPIFSNIDFSNAQIGGAVFSGGVMSNIDFTGATGTPTFPGTTVSNVTCPTGNPGSPTAPYCAWQPAAVTLGQTGAAAVPALWPAALFGLLLLGTAGLWLARRDAARTAVSL